jgi:hypothetical protein
MRLLGWEKLAIRRKTAQLGYLCSLVSDYMYIPVRLLQSAFLLTLSRPTAQNWYAILAMLGLLACLCLLVWSTLAAEAVT